MATFTSKYDMWDTVYLRTDPDQHPRLISGVEFRGSGNILYWLSFGTVNSSHYEQELSTEIDHNIKLDL